MTGSQARARDAARTAMVNQVANGIALLLNDAWSISPQWATCLTGTSLITWSVNGTTKDLWDYMSSIPQDPQSWHVNETCTGSVYVYIADNWTTAWKAAYVYADLEWTNGANVSDPNFTAGSTTASSFEAELNSWGTEWFAAFVR